MDQLDDILGALPDRVNNDPALAWIGRFCSVDFMLEIGETSWHFSIDAGMLAPPEKGPFMMKSWQFAIRGSEASWQEFWSPVPKPGYNDIFAMTAYGHARIDGDMAPLLADLRYIKEVLALPRGHLDIAAA